MFREDILSVIKLNSEDKIRKWLFDDADSDILLTDNELEKRIKSQLISIKNEIRKNYTMFQIGKVPPNNFNNVLNEHMYYMEAFKDKNALKLSDEDLFKLYLLIIFGIIYVVHAKDVNRYIISNIKLNDGLSNLDNSGHVRKPIFSRNVCVDNIIIAVVVNKSEFFDYLNL